jgi:phenylacetate-CoA ligase
MLLSLLEEIAKQNHNLHLTKAQIAPLQGEKFRKLVAFVAQKSPYYQRIMKDHGITIENCVPEDFPVLTKTDLLKHFDEIVTDRNITKAKIVSFLEQSQEPLDLFLDNYFVIHTSGSSGTISYYVYSQDEFIKGIAPLIRADGAQPISQKVAYIAATKGHFAGVTIVSAAKKLPQLYEDVQLFDINSPFAEIIDKVNHLQPTIVSGYAFALRALADAQRAGKLHIAPRILQSGGEPLSTEDKLFIQDTFKAPVVNIYASSEHLFMGIGRDKFQGMYLMEDNLLFEIHADYTCVTNLYNYTLPLIRYQMTDRLEPITDTTLQMPFTKIKEIVGRNEYVPVFTNDLGEDDFISPILLVEFFVKNLIRFQIHLIGKKEFIFKACLTDHLDSKEKEKTIKQITAGLHAILQEKKMTTVSFRIEIVTKLSVDPKTGKFRLIIKS